MQFSKSLGKQASYYRKALPGFFLCIFSSLASLKKPVFSKRGLLWWKVHTSQALLGSSDQQKVPATLFLKSEKIQALLSVGKGPEYRPFSDFRHVPPAYRPGTQISNHGRACTQAFLLHLGYAWGWVSAERRSWSRDRSFCSKPRTYLLLTATFQVS